MTKEGLEDVVIGNTAISSIVGNELRFRGIHVKELAEKSSFEEVVHLLWHGVLPTKSKLEELRQTLNENLSMPEAVMAVLKSYPKNAIVMDILRTTISLIGCYDPDAPDYSPESKLRKALRLVAQTPHVIASWEHIRNQRDPIHPRKGLGIAGNFLFMLRGKEASKEEVAAFDKALVLHADHELNASTFAARIAISTLSDLHSAVTSAIGTVKGPLHGGANQRAIEMLLNLKEPSEVQEYIETALKKKERVMGFGHRVYKSGDPRAEVLKILSKEIGRLKGNTKLYEIQTEMETLMREKKGLLPNIDFYSATLYHLLEIPHDLYTPIFAMARMPGWTAHIIEQSLNNRLIRPRAKYTGVKEAPYRPLSQRP